MNINKRYNRIDLNESICIIRRPRSAMVQYTKNSFSLTNDGEVVMAEKGKRECEIWRA